MHADEGLIAINLITRANLAFDYDTVRKNVTISHNFGAAQTFSRLGRKK